MAFVNPKFEKKAMGVHTAFFSVQGPRCFVSQPAVVCGRIRPMAAFVASMGLCHF